MATKEIRVITPVVGAEMTIAQTFASELSDGPFDGHDLLIKQVCIDEGPNSIESEYDEALAAPQILELARQAEKEGAAAIVIDCMGDPALGAVREILDIPVIGPNQAAMHTAHLLGQTFGLVVLNEDVVPGHHKLAAVYGLSDHLAAVVPVGIHAAQIGSIVQSDPDSLHSALGEAAEVSIQRGAQSVIIGCTGFLGLATEVRRHLKESGLAGIPVIDPIPNAILTAARLCDLQLTQSRACHPRVQPGK